MALERQIKGHDDYKREIPVIGEIWRHFKGHEYIIDGYARDTETGKIMIIYHEVGYDFKKANKDIRSFDIEYWCRPLGMFMGKLNKDKYPNNAQEYRFEKLK